MLRHRVIPALLLCEGGLVKTRKFKEPKYVGDPINAIRIFNEKEVDELLVLDIGASRRGIGPNFDVIESLASECFMPFCYGGGVSSIEQAARIFDLGVEKVSLQTAAIADLSLVSQIASRFGSQSVVVSVDVSRNWLGKARLHGCAGDSPTQNWLTFVKAAEAAGAGEIVLNAVDRDGTLQGYDLDLVEAAARTLSVPLVALGGAGNVAHFKEAITAGASAVAAGSFFVFHGPHRAVLITYPAYSELEALLEGVA